MTATKEKALTPARAKGQQQPNQTTQYQSHLEKSRAERIAKRRADMPQRYRKLYDRCTSGKSSPRQAIKMQCLECWMWVKTETETCDNYPCPLYKYNPLLKARQVRDSVTLEPKQARSQAGG